jgi:ABC-type microcin C transport system duplicated ATPase subunit YejF
MSEPVLALKDFTITRTGEPRPELDRFAVSIERGETVIMLGEADIGKDALMRALAGVPFENETVTGTVQFGIGAAASADQLSSIPIRMVYLPGPASRPLSAHASAASQLARVVARKAAIPYASGRAELGLVLARLKDAPPLEALEKSPSVLAPDVLAWGLLAAAFAATPELLLVDHLLVGLPPTSGRAIARALIAEQDRQRFAILYNAMSTEAARWLGGRLIVMRHGRIVEEGPVARLTTAQSHAYTQTLLKPPVPLVENRMAPRSARGQAIIQALGVTLKSREKLTFELRRGGSLALIGELGSGRRSLSRQLIGLEPIQAGRIVFDAVDIGVLSHTMMSRLRRRVAVIAGADDVLDPRLTISDTVSEPLRASLNLPNRLVAGYRDAALKRVGLSSLNVEQTVAPLSAFDKRRLQVARAIVSAPVLVLVEEPLRGLDAFAQSVMRDLLRSFRADEGPAFLVITSDMTVAQALAEDAMIFRDGHVVERGALVDMVRAPKEAYTRTLIDAASPAL